MRTEELLAHQDIFALHAMILYHATYFADNLARRIRIVNLYSFSFLSFGANCLTAATTINVMLPPNITEGIKPISFAATPDSNEPSSFDEPMNIPFTADTRPRISSGV